MEVSLVGIELDVQFVRGTDWQLGIDCFDANDQRTDFTGWTFSAYVKLPGDDDPVLAEMQIVKTTREVEGAEVSYLLVTLPGTTSENFELSSELIWRAVAQPPEGDPIILVQGKAVVIG